MVFMREILKVPPNPVHSMILLNPANLSFSFTYNNENSREANYSKAANAQTKQTIICLTVKHQKT